MFSSLWIAKTGLDAQQTRMDVISNNLANTNTDGFKASRVNFQDLLYMEKRQPGIENDIGSFSGSSGEFSASSEGSSGELSASSEGSSFLSSDSNGDLPRGGGSSSSASFSASNSFSSQESGRKDRRVN